MLPCVIVSMYRLSIDVFSSGGLVCLSLCEDFGGWVPCYLSVVLLRFAVWVLLGCAEWVRCLFLGAFAKMRKVTISFVMSVHPSVRMKQLGSHWTDSHEI